MQILHRLSQIQVLYNLGRAIEGNLEARPSVAVVEGFFDCIKVHEAGFRCVALMGSSLSQEQEKLLDRHFAHVVLLFDGDETGRVATDECPAEAWPQALDESYYLAGRQTTEPAPPGRTRGSACAKTLSKVRECYTRLA
jgi:hypothetical protein